MALPPKQWGASSATRAVGRCATARRRSVSYGPMGNDRTIVGVDRIAGLRAGGCRRSTVNHAHSCHAETAEVSVGSSVPMHMAQKISANPGRRSV